MTRINGMYSRVSETALAIIIKNGTFKNKASKNAGFNTYKT